MDDDLRGRLAEALGATYILGPEIGRGGMGVVFRATDTRLQRDVAVKVLPPELSYRAELRSRFVRESQMAGGLSHPNIVPIHDVGEQGDLGWYVMAFVDGESVRARVDREGPLTPAQTRRIIREVAWALSYAHARGIVHRDIKPDNIMLERGTGRALVTDFGIAKIAETDTPGAGVTMPGMVLGSLMYMAPEQASGEGEIDGRADIYSLGLCGLYMLTGEPPFEKATIITVAARVATGAVPDLHRIEQPIEPGLRDLLDKCVQADPAARWANAEQILEALGPQALAPRPMPAPIRRMVRDFMLFPTLAFIMLVTSIVTEDPTLGEFIGWMAIVLTVNFGVTFRSFSERGFQWPDLRDALEMELARQAEELDATGALKRRFSAIVVLATFAATTVGLLQTAIGLGLEPFIPIAAGFIVLAGLLTVPVSWLQIKIFTFLGRLALKMLPSFPRPESEGWFSRMADAVLTRLFRPIGIGSALALPEGQSSTSGWSESEIGTARRSTRSINELVDDLPRGLRSDLKAATRTARDLTAAIHDLRRQRAETDRSYEREMETLNSQSKAAASALERLRAGLEALIEGRGQVKSVRETLDAARQLLGRAPASQAARRGIPKGATGRWLGVRLNAAVTGSSSYRQDPEIDELAEDVTTGWHRHHALREALPHGAGEIEALVQRVSALQHNASHADRPLDPAAAETVTECQIVLRRLCRALDRYQSDRDGATRELESLLGDVQDIQVRIDSALEAESVEERSLPGAEAG